MIDFKVVVYLLVTIIHLVVAVYFLNKYEPRRKSGKLRFYCVLFILAWPITYLIAIVYLMWPSRKPKRA